MHLGVIYGVFLTTIGQFVSLGSAADKDDCSQLLTKSAMQKEVEYLFLEEIEGEQALSWVQGRNDQTLSRLKSDPRFAQIKEATLNRLNSKDRVQYALFDEDGKLYNFTRTEKNPRGILRRTSLKGYMTENPKWETVLNIDTLAEEEKENWVYKGHSNLKTKAMLFLSRGGKDAVVTREFDLDKKAFVKEGFFLKESKGSVTWLDQDTLMVATDVGPGSLTQSGYPRMLKLWRRSTSLEDAETIFEASHSDIGVYSWRLSDETRGEGPHKDALIIKQCVISCHHTEFFLFEQGRPLSSIKIPSNAEIMASFQSDLVVNLMSDWHYGGRVFPEGAVVLVDIDKLQSSKNEAVELIWQPGPTTAFQGVANTKDHLFIKILDNVSGKILEFSRGAKGWKQRELPLASFGSVDIISSKERGHQIFINQESFLTPGTLSLYSARTKKLRPIHTAPSYFDPTKYQVQQFHATSADGTRIPYFIVGLKGFKHDGKNPTLLYGYGGFLIAQTPHYSSIMEQAWLREGGVFVLANIRGGSEFGPAWHQAVLKENRQKVFDDFIAVAEGLVEQGVTSPRHLGIRGGSNGGLLVGATFTQRPDLFNAALIEVPLLDMMRYHKLLAGASWIGEYGDPDDPQMGPIIRAYSPYHNVYQETHYPEVFFMTSTKDDRVHPGHARRMAKKMEDQGHPFLYYENVEGGHGGSANHEQSAIQAALRFVYLLQKLK